MMKCSTLLRLFAATSLLSAPAWAAQIHGGQKVEHRSHLGQVSLDQMGYQVLGPGDLNGDQVSDYLISTIGHDQSTGRVQAFSGSTGQLIWETFGGKIGDRYGYAMVTLDDFTGDGISEIAISSPLYSGAFGADQGRFYIVSGSDGSTYQEWTSTDPHARLGEQISAADLNGDGFVDVIAGMPFAENGALVNAGRVLAYDIANAQLFPNSEYNGDQSNAYLGYSIAGVGDWNGDGYEDIAVGAPAADANGLVDNGRVNILSGAVLSSSVGGVDPNLAQLDGSQEGEWFGGSVANARDMNGDGESDLLVGSPLWDDLALGLDSVGRVTLWNGSSTSLITGLKSPDPKANGLFGSSVAFGGDIDHDGFQDLLIGAPYHADSSGNAVGAAFAFSGRTYQVLQRHLGQATDSAHGISVASMGDIDGDLTQEYIVGAFGNDPSGLSFSGATYIYGREAFLTQDVNSATPGDTVHYDIDFPVVGGSYKILISLMGTGPTAYNGTQVPLGPLHIPLNSNAYPSWTSGFFGSLNAAGEASASMTLPVTLPSITIFFAAVQSNTGGSVDGSSIVQILEVL